MIRVIALLTLFVAAEAHAQQHGLSLLSQLKYPAGFKQFDYVNSHAPKGGKITLSAVGGFDSLNPFIIKGRPAQNIFLIYDRLMSPSLDEPASAYGLLAQSVKISKNQVIFTLRRNAYFHDGKPITAEDVVWSFQQLKKAHPSYQAYYKNIRHVKKLSSHQVQFDLDAGSNRELPFILGQLPVLPKHYWQNKNFMATTLVPPLGSGPYKITHIEAGRSMTYQLVKNYWGRDLAVNRGMHNIGQIKVEYFGDRSVAFEAFKAHQIDFYLESVAKNWALGYQRIKNKTGLVREEIENKNPVGMQAFVLNIRQKKFQDPLVRQALNYAFDFEWMNRNFFHQAYRRTNSYFEGSDLAAKGLPKGRELKLLEAHRDSLADTVFTQSCSNPRTTGDGNNRTALRKAARLLKQAGWVIKNNRLIESKTGKAFDVEFLLFSPAFEKVVLAYKRQLEKLGIQVKVQLVDFVQYRNRLRNFDFDIVIETFSQSLSPGNEQRDFWGSQAAQIKGGRNLIGIQNKIVDALIEKIIHAENRSALIAATRALDRILCAGHYVVPQWHLAIYRLAFWRPLQHPKTLPPYGLGFPSIWWVTP